jgi:ABC-2 type transport system permease protein
MREPAALFWGIAFPLLLTVIFGIATSSQKPDHKLGGMRVVDAYVPALQALPSALASYREKGVLRRMSTTPVPPSLLLGADVIVSATVIVFALAMIAVIARVAFNVALPTQAVGFAVARGATNREAAAQLFIS